MRYLFFILTGLFAASFAGAQSLPQGAEPLQVSTQEEATNTVAQGQASAGTNQVNTSRASFLMDAGVQYADEGEYAEAEQAYLRALEADPQNPNIRFRLSTLYIQMKQSAKATDLLEALAKEFPDNPGIHNNLAWVYATAAGVRDGKLALRHAREAILIQPNSPPLWNTLAEAYYAVGQYDKALRSSEVAIDLLKAQNGSEEDQAAFAAQQAKIQRAMQGYKMMMGLDEEE